MYLPISLLLAALLLVMVIGCGDTSPGKSKTQAEKIFQQAKKTFDQSIYFSALCGSLAPPRATGGFRMSSGGAGSHFWAEFYLPNYGWVPGDTSAAQLALFPANLTQEQRQDFLNFFFMNMDSMRCIVQKSVEEPFIPTAGPEPQVVIPMLVQAASGQV